MTKKELDMSVPQINWLELLDLKWNIYWNIYLPLISLYSLIIIFEVITIIVTVKSQLFANSLSISRTKYIITYCFPFYITVEFNVSLIRITASLKLYQTRERITVPDPSGICCKNDKYWRIIYTLTAANSSIIRVSIITSSIDDSRERDSQYSTVEVIHCHRKSISAI